MSATRRASIVCVLLLAACGGGSSSIAPQASLATTTQRASVSLTLTIPPQARSGARQAQTISSATQSVGVVVNSGSQQVFNATPSSGGCSTSDAGTTCTFNVVAPAGSDTFTVTTYDALNCGGTALDQATLMQTILPNASNSVSIRLGPAVSNTNDSGAGSLRQAIADASTGETVVFVLATPTTINLASPLSITKNLTIAGSGSSNIRVSGNNAVQILTIAAGTTVTLSGMTFIAGTATNGGAISNSGTLNVLGMTISNSQATNTYGGGGGAIYNGVGATLAVSGSTFSANTSPYGGSIYSNHSTVTIGSSSFLPTIAPFNEYGGGIYNYYGNLTLTNTTFAGINTLHGNAGAVFNEYGTFTMTGGSVTNCLSYDGGAMFLDRGSSSLTNVTFTGNSGSSYAGAIDNDVAPLTLSNVTFSNNTTNGPGGALYIYSSTLTITGSTFSGNTAGNAGAIYEDASAATITNSTFSGNRTSSDAAAIYYYGNGSTPTLTITGSTLSGNSTTVGYGAAIYAATAGLSMINDTVSSNTAGGSSRGGGALYTTANAAVAFSTFFNNSAPLGYGGNIFVQGTPTVTVLGSIIAGGTASSSNDIYGNLNSQDYDLIQDMTGATIGGTTTHNITGIAPNLLPLANNGGSTQTHADQSTSPGKDYIPLSICSGASVTTDQRGNARGDGGDNLCDIGAYEFP